MTETIVTTESPDTAMAILTTRVRHAGQLSDYYLRNAARFSPWNPLVQPGHHDIDTWVRRLRDRERDYAEGKGAHFIGLQDGRVICGCSLTNIVYHPACYCHMGYSVDGEFEGRGYMTRLVRHVIDYAFNALRMNRICANYMPANTRSARLLEKLGFVKEGYAEKYLCINGKWEDHVLTSLLNPAHNETR
jgi:ribosomal-protein-alanine N-acetyltransferase